MCGDGHDHDHDHKHEHEQEALHIEPDVLANLADLELEFEKAEIEARKSPKTLPILLIALCKLRQVVRSTLDLSIRLHFLPYPASKQNKI